MSGCWSVELCEGAAPINLHIQCEHPLVYRDAAPIELYRDATPIELCRDATPIELYRCATPIGSCIDTTPIGLL